MEDIILTNKKIDTVEDSYMWPKLNNIIGNGSNRIKDEDG